MSGKNPFYTDDDDGLGAFGSSGGGAYRGASGAGGSTGRFDSGFGADDSWQTSTQAQIEASKQRQLESQKNALRSIYDSERVGVATAEELLEQGEQLRRTEQRLDDIGQMQNSSQRSLNSLKSVFGGVRNWWGRGKNTPAPAPAGPSTPAGQYTGAARLQDASAYSASAQSKVGAPAAYGGGGGGARGEERDFDANTDEMANGMSRLKQLALGLGDEIDSQNKDLDRIGAKTNSVNARMDSQNKQMRHILGSGKK